MSKDSLLQNKDSRNMFQSRKELVPTFFLSLIVLLGASLRFYNLGTESYWIDEMSTVVEGQQSIQQLFASGRLDQPPAYYLPFHFWVQFFGTTEVGTRSFSTLAGIGSIVLIYLIGRELFGKSIGLLSAFLMAISQFQLYYSQQARFYSFFEFSTLLSCLFFILALRNKRKVYFMLYGIASALLVYSHIYGLFILAAQAIFFIMQWKKHRDMIAIWLISQILILLLTIPYFYPLIFGGSGLGGAVDKNVGGLTPPSLLEPLRSVYRFIMSARGERSWGIMLVNYAIAATLFVTGMWIYVARQGVEAVLDAARGWFANLREIPDFKSKLLFIICWLLCPIMFPFVLSMAFRPMYLDRYTISAAPALYLLLALGIFSIRRVVPIIISLGILVIMIGPSLGYYYVTDLHEQWKEVAAYVSENSEQDDVIVFAPNLGIGIEQSTFNWYYQGALQGYGLGSDLVESTAISDALKKITSGHNRLWVIIRDNPNSSSDRYTSFFLNPDQTDMRLITEHNFVEISVYLFELLK